MTGLCGWSCGTRAREARPELISKMASPLRRFDASAVRTAAAPFGSIAVAGTCVDLFHSEARLVAIWGDAQFVDRDLAELTVQHGLAHAVADGYSRKRTGVLAVLNGSFAVAILDRDRGETVLATDRIGTHPLAYSEVDGQLVFASTLAAIDEFAGSSRDIDAQSIYDYVHFHMVPAPRTAYRSRRYLLPGTYLRWRDSKAEIAAYWEMRFFEDEIRPFPELKSRFREALRTSVRDAVKNGTTGAFLSGGTDSSTIAGLLGEVTGEPARTYSIGFEAEGYDEMYYARIAARHFGTHHHEYYVTPADVVSAIPRIAAVHDQPFGNASAVPTYYCAKLARDDGIETLLGGDGGDELFGGNERYAKQYLYSLYSDLPAALRTRFIEPVVFRAPAVSIAGKVQRYMRNATEPMPARYDNYNLLERLGPETVFTDEFLDAVDTRGPQAQMAIAYERAHARTLINRMLALDLKFTLADNDLPKVMRSCELAGVDVKFPMLDDAVVAFSATLAPQLKLKRTQLRYFFKEALRDFLPNEIITKRKHGFGLPFGLWLRTDRGLQELVADSLAGLKQRRIVRTEFIDQLMTTHLQHHAAYYGTMAWVLMMLEQWFQQHNSGYALSRAA
jgi:asparagine synthase (glutamine-hydrolysing)